VTGNGIEKDFNWEIHKNKNGTFIKYCFCFAT
jgi:hypothetical protein